MRVVGRVNNQQSVSNEAETPLVKKIEPVVSTQLNSEPAPKDGDLQKLENAEITGLKPEDKLKFRHLLDRA